MFFFLQASGFLGRLKDADQWLFVRVNTGLANPFFDAVMPFMRTSLNWAPLYLFVISFALLNFRVKGLWWSVFFVSTVALTDMIGTYVFKHGFERLRPCNDPDFYYRVRLVLDHCNPGYSFISNHAANHFGLATFFFITARPLFGSWAAIGLLWAAIIAFAQVYIGIHYPLDVLAGTLLGLILGVFTGSLFNKRFGFAIFDNQPTLSS